MKKIYRAHGISGIYKGQAVTLLREASGYGVYFLAYEKLVQREMKQKNIKREEISPSHAILYGATAGYAVSTHLHSPMQFSIDLGLDTAVGCNIPNRHDQIPYADRWILALYGSKIQIDSPLRTHYMAK